MNIFHFTINYQEEPIALDQKPYFFWRTDLPQKSYHIKVLKNLEIVYDSGVIDSKENVAIEYLGKPLISDTRYTVFLETISTEGEKAEKITFFNTGLLNKEDWKGKWVNMPANFMGKSLLIRLQLSDMPLKKIHRAHCFVAGLGYHEFYLNGKKVGDALLAPAVSDISKRVYYKTYDITKLLFDTENVIGFMLGNGWVGQEMLLVQLNVEFEDGSRYEAHTGHGAWWTKTGAIVSNSVYGGETYDARLEVKDWSSKECIADWNHGWMYLLNTLLYPTGKLVSQNVEDIKVCQIYSPISSFKKNESSIIYDLGQNISGWGKIHVQGESGAKITLLYAEDITQDKKLNRINLRCADCMDTYILKGEGEEEYSPRFTYHGFRYIEVIIEGKAELISIVGEHVHSDVLRSGNFVCSDNELNRLHKMAYITEENNLQSIMTDCPQRDERFMWLNDLASRIYESVNNFDMSIFYEKVMNDISDTQNKEGAIADTAPYFTAQRPADPVSICYLLFALRSYERFGNKKIIDEHYNHMKAWTDFLLSKSTDYLMDYSYYGDWVVPFNNQAYFANNRYVSAAYLYWHIHTMMEIARIKGDETTFKNYSQRETECRNAFNRRFYHSQEKYYDNDNQTANAIALSLGITPKEDRSKLAHRICSQIIDSNYHVTCGNQGYRHLFYVLAEYGYIDEILKALKNPEYPGWGYMLACGATTVWERWEKEMTLEMHSFDHPMFAAYDGMFYEFICGIRIPTGSFGGSKAIICPIIPKSLEYAKGKILTARGYISVSWYKKQGQLIFDIEIPQGCTAEILLCEKIKDSKEGGSYHYEISI